VRLEPTVCDGVPDGVEPMFAALGRPTTPSQLPDST
jgi:hypothetical protein